jgi:Salmonella virulence plasmid 65kDa B protein
MQPRPGPSSAYEHEQASAAGSGQRRHEFVKAPAVSLPKGGGTIRGIGEKFATNPVTGTGSLSVPIAISPGRSGFGPQLSLSYDSGAGNGVFGFGWSLRLPQISRKTDKGLPRYDDAFESDVFMLSGAEDLVPVYRQDPDGSWIAGHPGYQRDPAEFWVRDASGRIDLRQVAHLIARLDGEEVAFRPLEPDQPFGQVDRGDRGRHLARPLHHGRLRLARWGASRLSGWQRTPTWKP